jgi:hypothetical protein
VIKALFGSRSTSRVSLKHLLQEILAFVADSVNVHAYRRERVAVLVSQKHFLRRFPLEHVLAAKYVEENTSHTKNVRLRCEWLIS